MKRKLYKTSDYQNEIKRELRIDIDHSTRPKSRTQSVFPQDMVVSPKRTSPVALHNRQGPTPPSLDTHPEIHNPASGSNFQFGRDSKNRRQDVKDEAVEKNTEIIDRERCLRSNTTPFPI